MHPPSRAAVDVKADTHPPSRAAVDVKAERLTHPPSRAAVDVKADTHAPSQQSGSGREGRYPPSQQSGSGCEGRETDPPFQQSGSGREGRYPPSQQSGSGREGRYPPSQQSGSGREGRETDPPSQQSGSGREGRYPPSQQSGSGREGRETDPPSQQSGSGREGRYPPSQQSGSGREGRETDPPSQQSGSGREGRDPPSQQSSGENQRGGLAERDSTLEAAGPEHGMKFVIDNIDKNIKPRFMSSEKQTKSIHYVQMYAARDRTDISQLSDSPPVINSSLTVDEICKTILPSPEDNDAVAEYFSTLVSRALVTHMPFFHITFADVVQWRVPHKFTEEMSQKSEVVSILCVYIVRYTVYIIQYTCRFHWVCCLRMKTNLKIWCAYWSIYMGMFLQWSNSAPLKIPLLERLM